MIFQRSSKLNTIVDFVFDLTDYPGTSDIKFGADTSDFLSTSMKALVRPRRRNPLLFRQTSVASVQRILALIVDSNHLFSVAL